MHKGIKNIEKLVNLHKNNQLDYLTVCDLVRKILDAYDFDKDKQLDKIEYKALVDNFLTQMQLTDTSLNQDDFREMLRAAVDKSTGFASKKEILNIICVFFVI